MNAQLTIAGQDVEVIHAKALPSGYGHKEITVELMIEGRSKKFTAITSNMPDYDASTELEGDDKYAALFKLISAKIEDQIIEWLIETEQP